jgi:chemotaxis protein MotD
MTTIDQSALSLAVPHNAKNSVANDKGQGSAKHEKAGKSFDDLVSEAKQKLASGASVDDDAALDVDGVEAGEITGADAATKNGAEAGSRVKISTNFQNMLKAANAGQTLAANAENKAQSDKDAQTVGKKADTQKAKAVDADDKPAISASEQLSMLLGMTSTEDESAGDEVDVAASTTNSKKSRNAEDKTEVAESKDSAAEKNAVTSAIDVLKQAAAQVHAASQSSQQADDGSSAEAELEDDSNDIVRLVSKDGKGAPVDVPLTETTEGKTDTSSLSSAKTDFVTVLDSRRYLGFSSDTNAAALTSAIKADPTWSSALNSVTAAQNAIEGNTTTTVNTLKLQMNPENLGSMTASLRLKGEELTVEVKVETVEAYRHLTNDHDQILKALKDQGFSIDQVSIQLSSATASDKTDLGQDRSNQSGQDLRDNQGQSARQREENERRTGNQDFWRNNEKTSSQSDLGNTSDDVGTGNIYL